MKKVKLNCVFYVFLLEKYKNVLVKQKKLG